MRKIISLFIVLILNANFAYGQTFTENTAGACNFDSSNAYLSAIYEPNEHTCSVGYYLPANVDECMPCPNMYRCDGGTFSFNPDTAQGLVYNGGNFDTNINNFCAINIPKYLYAVYEPNEHICGAGYYLPANVDECVACISHGVCPGGTYTFNETMTQGFDGCENGYNLSNNVCVANVINITWDNASGDDIAANDAGTVTYGGDIRTPKKAQHINGKIFVGWTFNAQ